MDGITEPAATRTKGGVAAEKPSGLRKGGGGKARPMMRRSSARGEGDDLAADLLRAYQQMIGRRLRDLREDRGLTQEDVAGELEPPVRAASVSSWEAGRLALSPERYEQIADLYRVNRAEFGQFMLRYTNPWLYALLYGRKEAELKRDLEVLTVPRTSPRK
jgi:transcriptional regulator with XRE-family HTH domain